MLLCKYVNPHGNHERLSCTHTETGSHRSLILNYCEVRMTPHDSEFTLPVADVSLTPLERGTRALAKSPRKKQKIADSGNLNTQATRTNYKKVKGKRGRLKLMTEIPMDILLEIFSHLQPVDVLHLSRVSRRLRDLLTSSNIRYIWTSVCPHLPLINSFDNGNLSVRFMRI